MCRVRNNFTEVRQKGWLPSAVGLGTVVEFSCFVDTEVDIAIHQEGHVIRGATGSHLTDLGFAILRRSADGKSYELVDDTPRKMQPIASKAVTLGEGTYIMVPLCFNQMVVPAPRKYQLVTHTSQPLLIEQKPCETEWMAEVVLQRAIKHGTRKELIPAKDGGPVATYVYYGDGESGMSIVAENASNRYCLNIGVDLGESTGMVSTRGTLFSQDAIPPRSRAVVFVLSPEEGAEKYGWSMQQSFDVTQGVEMHIPPLDPESKVDQIHQALPIPPGQLPSAAPAVPNADAFAQIMANIANIGRPAGSPATSPTIPPAAPPAMPPAPVQTEEELEEEMMQAAIRASLGENPDTGQQ